MPSRTALGPPAFLAADDESPPAVEAQAAPVLARSPGWRGSCADGIPWTVWAPTSANELRTGVAALTVVLGSGRVEREPSLVDRVEDDRRAELSGIVPSVWVGRVVEGQAWRLHPAAIDGLRRVVMLKRVPARRSQRVRVRHEVHPKMPAPCSVHRKFFEEKTHKGSSCCTYLGSWTAGDGSRRLPPGSVAMMRTRERTGLGTAARSMPSSALKAAAGTR